MFLHTLLADAQPMSEAAQMSALLGSGLFKNIATLVLIAVAVVALAWPAALAKGKAWIAAFIETKLRDVARVADLPASPFSPSSSVVAATPVNVSEIVQNLAISLKTCCPNAPPELRLKWLEKGFNTEAAKADYISVLEAAAGGTPSRS